MHTPSEPGTTRRITTHWWLPHVTAAMVVVLLLVLLADPVQAAGLPAAAPPAPPPSPQEAPLVDVINKLIGVLVTLLVTLSTLFITAAGVRYVTADGDPGQIERAKKSLINACIGFGIAILAPVLVGILQSVLS